MLHDPKHKFSNNRQYGPPANQRYDWDKAAVEVLRREYARGTSDSIIVRLLPVDKLGRRPTRNAVIGKRHRLGITGGAAANPARPMSGQRAERKKRSNGSARAKGMGPIPPNVLAAVRAADAAKAKALVTKSQGSGAILEPVRTEWPLTVALRKFDAEIPETQRKNIFQLEVYTCRWPVGHVGDPDFFFCGGVSAEGSSYCASHKVFSSYRTQESMPIGRRVTNAIPKPS